MDKRLPITSFLPSLENNFFQEAAHKAELMHGWTRQEKPKGLHRNNYGQLTIGTLDPTMVKSACRTFTMNQQVTTVQGMVGTVVRWTLEHVYVTVEGQLFRFDYLEILP